MNSHQKNDLLIMMLFTISILMFFYFIAEELVKYSDVGQLESGTSCPSVGLDHAVPEFYMKIHM